MTREQKIVLAGALPGVLFMAFAVWVLQRVLPVPLVETASDKLVYALKWDALAAVPFFAMIVAVGNQRFFSEAIDPTIGKGSDRMLVDGRVTDNTAQQLLLFLIGSAALAVNLSPERLPVIGAAAITFAIMRIAFWGGYRIHPLHRAFGFAGTAYLNLCLLGAALWLSLS